MKAKVFFKIGDFKCKLSALPVCGANTVENCSAENPIYRGERTNVINGRKMSFFTELYSKDSKGNYFPVPSVITNGYTYNSDAFISEFDFK